MTSRSVAFLSNNGDIGGGEVMLLAMAEAARDAGYAVTVAAPDEPGECADRATQLGVDVARIPGTGRRAYMRHLRAWARGRTGLLWCNGLVPATATAGLRSARLVHLHRFAKGPQRVAAWGARRGAVATVVPSRFMADQVSGATVLANWTDSPGQPRALEAVDGFRLGYLGRLAPEKGITVLLEALRQLRGTGLPVSLLVAGETRFVSDAEAADLQRQLRDAGDGVTLGGWMPSHDLFSRIDALVVPSLGAESFGLSAAEAMGARVPVVVTDAGALPEVVGGAHPFVARHGDGADLARVISTLIADPITTAAATDAAYARWAAEFAPDAGAQRFVGLLDALHEQNGRPR